MLKSHNTTVPVNPDQFIKNFNSDQIQKVLADCNVKTANTYEQWQKVDVKVKTRSGDEKIKKKINNENNAQRGV